MEARKTWQRLSVEERDNIFVIPLQELSESAASLTSSKSRQSAVLS